MSFDVYGTLHPAMRQSDTIDIIGFNGDRVRISGPGMQRDWGPQLATGSTGLFEAAVKTNWVRYMFGQRYESKSPQRRDVVFTVHLMNPETGVPALDNDPFIWHTIYSRWRAMWSYDYESTVVYGSFDGERHLGLRLLQEPKPFGNQQFEGGDPHRFPYGSIVMPVAAEFPYYLGPTERFAHEGPIGDTWFTMPFFNPCSVEIWPEWYGTDRARYVFPDYSWGNEEYGRGWADAGKTVQVPTVAGDYVREGESFHIVTRPDEPTLQTQNAAPLGSRMNGTDFEYPILPGAGSADAGCVVRAIGVTNPDGFRVELDLPRWHSEPFSTPRVV